MRHDSVTNICYLMLPFRLSHLLNHVAKEMWQRFDQLYGIRPSLGLSPMPSEIGLAVWTSVMNVHTLVDAARNQTATKPAAEKTCISQRCNSEESRDEVLIQPTRKVRSGNRKRTQSDPARLWSGNWFRHGSWDRSCVWMPVRPGRLW